MVKQFRNIVVLILLFSASTNAQLFDFKLGQVRGLFLGFSVGPTLAIGDFADKYSIGSNFEASLSYADNNIVPVFFYGKLKYTYFQADFVNVINNPSFELSTKFITVEPGVRFYFPPIAKEVIILMPYLDVGLELSYLLIKKQQTIGYKAQFYDNQTKLGINVGFGVSMFLLDTGLVYNYSYGHQYIGLDLKIRIPIFVKV